MTPLPLVSIIVLNYNGLRFLDECISSLSRLSYPKELYEIIVVDNCSVDGSVEYLRTKYSWVKSVSLDKNYGFTGGNNKGADFAKGDYIVFLNNDVAVEMNWLTELVEYSQSHPNSMVTSKAFLLNNPRILNHDGSKATLIGRGFCVNFCKPDIHDNAVPKYVVQPYGASMMLRRSLFYEIGKFDEDYFTSLEDLDIGLRMWLYGYEVVYIPSSVYYHYVGASCGEGSKLSDTITYHVTKNSYLNIMKNFELVHATQGIFLSLIYNACWSLWLVKKTRKLHAVRIIASAHVWVLRNFGTIIYKRGIVSKNSKRSRNFLFQPSFFASIPEMIRTQLSLWNGNYLNDKR